MEGRKDMEKKESGKREIVIRAKKVPYLQEGQQPIVRLKPDAYNQLVDFANESGIPIGEIATEIIRQGAALVVFDRK